MKSIPKSKLRTLAILCIIGIAYAIWILITGLAIPCPIRKITGLLCPGCGITTLFICLFRLNIKEAFYANPFLFITMPYLIFELIYSLNPEHRKNKKNNISLLIYAVLFILWGVLRNAMPPAVHFHG